jgi:hypothetical protein
MDTFRRTLLGVASLSLAFVPPAVRSQAFSVPNTFVSGTPATAADVNANFSATATAINGKQNLVTGACPAGSAIQAINANGTVVCQQLSFFGGDGSAGNLTVAANTDWTIAPPVNLNFASIVINNGQTLTVPAGTTIRCSGTFTNNGAVTVTTGARLAGLDNFSFGATVDIYSVGHPGDSFRPASGGGFDNNSVAAPKLVQGGLGGDPIPPTTARTSFNAFRFGGGSGAGWRSGAVDGNGGGLVKIYCTGDVINAGVINANGGTSSTLSGGGGGGIVILASASTVTNSGTINVVGGSGGPSFAFGGAGGGGGGGIAVLVAPAVAVGTINVGGGSGGSVATQVAVANRYGGGGGGASGGAGGNGSDIPATATATAATPTSGAAGYVQSIIANPAFLLH